MLSSKTEVIIFFKFLANATETVMLIFRLQNMYLKRFILSIKYRIPLETSVFCVCVFEARCVVEKIQPRKGSDII